MVELKQNRRIWTKKKKTKQKEWLGILQMEKGAVRLLETLPYK